MGWVVNDTPQPFYFRDRDPLAMIQRAGWASGPVWTGAENLAPTGIRFPDHPAHIEPLITGCHASLIIVEITPLINEMLYSHRLNGCAGV
jgi:hypothetical protein